MLLVALISSTVCSSDNFVEDYLKKPWKLVPLYHVGNVIHSLATEQKVTPHEAISAAGGLFGTAAVAIAGERNTDKFVDKTNQDLIMGLSNYIKDHQCVELLASFSPVTQFICHPYAFNFKTMEDIEIPVMTACLGLDAGSLLAPVIVDLGTLPFQTLCSEWYNYRIELYSHLKGVSPDDYEFLLDLPEVSDSADDPGTIIAYGENKTDVRRYRRGIFTSVAKSAAGHTLLKLIRPRKIYNNLLSMYVSKTFRGPTGKVLSETTMEVIKNMMRVERANLDPAFKITQKKLHDMVRRYFFMPEMVVQSVPKKVLAKPEKVNLVKAAMAKYKPNPFG